MGGIGLSDRSRIGRRGQGRETAMNATSSIVSRLILAARGCARIRRKFIALVARPGYVLHRLNFRRRCGAGDRMVTPAFERANMIRLLSRVAAAVVSAIVMVA